MLIYSDTNSPRLIYTLDFILKDQCGTTYELTSDIALFKNSNQPKLNYSGKHFDFCSVFIKPHTLLNEVAVQAQNIETVLYNGVSCPFQTEGVFPFDLFCAIFYLITRYEEYLPHQQDQYGRFKAKESFAYKNNFLQLPVVDIWIQDLKEKLQAYYPEISFKQPQFSYQFTYDIDVAFAFKGRPSLKNMALLGKDLLTNTTQFKKRWQVLNGNETDIYDTYKLIDEAHKKLQQNPLYFFLVGDRGEYNKNIEYNNPVMKTLIEELIENGSEMGIHPSYDSPRNKRLILEEKNRMEGLTKNAITKSRQHYLRFYLPTTYNHLMAIGITDDYSMGYADMPGFRAGTSHPFYFYDLVNDVQTNLKVHPVTLMEGSFAEDMQMQPQDALELMKQYVDEVKKVNGHFLCIWHNHTLSDDGFWKGWKNVYEELVNCVIKEFISDNKK